VSIRTCNAESLSSTFHSQRAVSGTLIYLLLIPSDQILNIIVKNERPDVYEKKLEFLKLQGEYQIKLRTLENDLLTLLNTSQSNLLEDDTIIHKLELLKTESTTLASQSLTIDTFMIELSATLRYYQPLSTDISKTFFILESLLTLNHFYQFSLVAFMQTFTLTLRPPPSSTSPASFACSLETLKCDFFDKIYCVYGSTMRNEDKNVLGFLLFSVKDDVSEFKEQRELLDSNILSATDIDTTLNTTRAHTIDTITSLVKQMPSSLLSTALKSHLQSNTQVWTDFMNADCAETCIPSFASTTSNPTVILLTPDKTQEGLTNLLILRYLRPDRLLSYLPLMLSNSLKPLTTQSDHLSTIVFNEMTCTVPLLYASAKGYDAGFLIESFARRSNVTLLSIGLGSPESLLQAEKSIQSASKSGGWVLLSNLHLVPHWIQTLEKKLSVMTLVKTFRLFITTELSDVIPATLIRQSKVHS